MVKRWFEKVTVSFGWIDLDPNSWKGFQFDQIAPPLVAMDVKRASGEIVHESAVNFVAGKGRRFESARYEVKTPGGVMVLQYFLENGDPRRIYFGSVEGKKATRSSPWVDDFFNSFQPK